MTNREVSKTNNEVKETVNERSLVSITNDLLACVQDTRDIIKKLYGILFGMFDVDTLYEEPQCAFDTLYTALEVQISNNNELAELLNKICEQGF